MTQMNLKDKANNAVKIKQQVESKFSRKCK